MTAITIEQIEENTQQKNKICHRLYALLLELRRKIESSELGPTLHQCVVKLRINPTFRRSSTFRGNVEEFIGKPLTGDEAELLRALETHHSQKDKLLATLASLVGFQRQAIEQSKIPERFPEILRRYIDSLRTIVRQQSQALESGDVQSLVSTRNQEVTLEQQFLQSAQQSPDQRIQSFFRTKMTRRAFLKTAVAGVVVISGLALTRWYFAPLANLQNDSLVMKGINYDIGTQYTEPTEQNKRGFTTRRNPASPLTKDLINKEITQIKQELHCNAIRIYGGDRELLLYTTQVALSLGLQVMVSPRFINNNQQETLQRIREVAQDIETLKTKDVLFCIGNEFTLDSKGFLQGNTYEERAGSLSKFRIALGLYDSLNKKLNEFLTQVVQEVRAVLSANVPLVYAAGYWEQPNWDLFDYVAGNFFPYSSSKFVFGSLVDKHYEKFLHGLHRWNKPIIITEFGCSSYKGAQYKGLDSWRGIVNFYPDKMSNVNPGYVRDESAQAEYITTSLQLFNQKNIHGAFVFTYVEPQYVHHPDQPQYDLDMASLGILKVYPGANNQPSYRMEPKKSFFALAKAYST